MRIYVLISVLAIVSVYYFATEWQNKSVPHKAPTQKAQQPDFIATGLSVKIFDETGQAVAKLSADNMQYYMDQKTANFSNTQYIIFNALHTAEWHLVSTASQLIDNQHLHLNQGVEITSSTSTNWLNNLQTDTLSLDLKSKKLSSHDQITITSDDIHLTGLGLKGDLNKQEFELQNDVKATITP